MTAEEAPVARLDHVTHRYGKTQALDDLSLDIPAGKMIGVIGPDGVGKSTLLALVSGVRKIQTGRVETLGADMSVARAREAEIGRIAYMPQGLGRNLYPTLSVYENIDFHARLFGQDGAERRARIAELLAATGLDPFANRPAAKLSGGMKQKLSLCSVLIHDPDLLVLDEPTTGVDPLSRRQFWELIDTIRARRPGMSVIVATAYMEEAARFDWLVAMDDGKVLATGTPAEILSKANATSLDAAFVALLPEEKRAAHKPVIVRPREEPEDATPAIEANGLTRRFGDFVAVDHVSFRIGRGEIFGFLGSNGCGKSTTMKMLTGLLPASEGTMKLFGTDVGGATAGSAADFALRMNVGYMSQAFSLYGELTVRQNLTLHAELYQLPTDAIPTRIAELLTRFDLTDVADTRPESLPLGIRQRLQLAVAILHRPAMLILDEPTSGVDPVARDQFWRTLIELSRDDGVTIFLSTHFMSEAERCDRISFMHAGRVLAVGAPDALRQARGVATLEDAFIAYLEAAQDAAPAPSTAPTAQTTPPQERAPTPVRRFDSRRLWASTRREMMELMRDPVRMAFAFFAPVVLMLAFGFGISFDIENLRFAAFDQDHSLESRTLIEQFTSSRYFRELPPINSAAERDERLVSGDAQIVLEIPPGFGRDLLAGHHPQLDVLLDGSSTFRAETARGYVTALASNYATSLATSAGGPSHAIEPVGIETRFRYNQDFRSANALVPSIIMLMLIIVPAIMSAVSVVREKETGSIANFRATPISSFEFLFGKQLPYIAVSMASYLFLCIIAYLVFDVPIKGSFLTLTLATFFYVAGTTGFGQLISSFTRTQVSAVFATAILSIIPAINFSGLLVPVASLSGGGRVIGLILPPAWYQPVSVGTFTKGLSFLDLWQNIAMLAGFFIVFLVIAQLALKKQEA